jgi:rhamnulokinase
MASVTCAAIDLGATSGRVIVGEWGQRRPKLTEVHRFPNTFRSLGRHDYWHLPGLWAEIQTGLLLAKKKFPRLASVGVDTWGCDHALVNDAGRLVFPAHAYRDGRTQPGLKALARQGLERVYAATGIPNVFYNSSLQLAEVVASCPAITDLATRCLFLPDYFNFLLSGRMENELSIASTTQLLDVRGCGWSREALEFFHIPPHWFSTPVLANTRLGPVRSLPELKGVQVIAVPGHDTASAYDAMPADPAGGDLYISSGTWSLVGFESGQPILGKAALRASVANERTGTGGYRPLTNIVGLWLLEQTILHFGERPRNPGEWSALITAAEKLPAPAVLLDVADPAFVRPASMRAAIDTHLKKRHARPPKDLAGYMRLICASLGRGHAQAMRVFEKFSGKKFQRILMVGGGAKNRLLCQATADAAQVPVLSFALEGTALGNLASQWIALKVIKDRAEFRRHLADGLRSVTYLPKNP